METVINLDTLEQNRVLSAEELIYREECSQLSQLILKKVGSNVENMKKVQDLTAILHQPCFFISGGRGSGKTTLVRAVIDSACNDQDAEMPKLALLAEIDPTELADTENFFIHVMGRMQKKLSEYKSVTLLNNEQKNLINLAYSKINNMSKGLGLLVRNPESLADSSDAEFFIQQSVADCVSGVSLKENFAALVDAVCKLLKLDAFLITVDDADMNFNKCQEVFETVRKYLINPRMAFLFAGDLKLYTMVVRGMQMQHFGELALRHDRSRANHRNMLVDALEDQYMTKLIPAENRIELTDFSAVLMKNPRICVRNAKKKDENVKIDEHLDNFLGKDVKLHNVLLWKEYIKQLSIRSALQLLSFWKHNGASKWRDGIRMVVAHALIKHRVDYQSVQSGRVDALAQHVIEHAANMGAGISRAGILPWDGTSSQQMVSFYLAAEINHLVRDVRGLLLYYLTVFPQLQMTDKKLHGSFVYNRTFSYRILGAESTAAMLPSMESWSYTQKPFSNGVIPMFSQTRHYEGIEQVRCSVQDFVLSLSSLSPASRSERATCDTIVAIFASMCRVVVQGCSIYCLSVYNLLAKIVQLLSIPLERKTDRKEHILHIILENTFALPTIVQNDTLDRREVVDAMVGLGNDVCLNRDFKDKYSKSIKKLVEDISRWITDVQVISISSHPVEFQQVWMRFYRESLIITNKAKTKAAQENSLVKAGSLFKDYLDCFLNALPLLNTENGVEFVKVIKECPLIKAWGDDISEEVLKMLNGVNIGALELTINPEVAESLCRWRVGEEYSKLKRNMKSTLYSCLNDYQEAEEKSWWSRLLTEIESRLESPEGSFAEKAKPIDGQLVVTDKEERENKVKKLKDRKTQIKKDRERLMLIATEEIAQRCSTELELKAEASIKYIMELLSQAENLDMFERKMVDKRIKDDLRVLQYFEYTGKERLLERLRDVNQMIIEKEWSRLSGKSSTCHKG